MKTMFVTIILLFLTLSTYAEDMQKYLSDTQDLVRQGKHKEALERYIWFHDHALEHDPAMYGVRLSFALSYWKELGDIYPPAQKAIIETRDRKAKQIVETMGTVSLFHDVVALNDTLEDGQKTVELFEILHGKRPEFVKQCWNIAKEAVISAKRYDLAKKYMSNPENDFVRIKSMYDYNTTLYNNPDIGGTHFKAYNENHFVEECLQLIEVSLAIGNIDSAKEIQKKALAVINDNRLRDAVREEKKQDAQSAGADNRSAK